MDERDHRSRARGLKATIGIAQMNTITPSEQDYFKSLSDRLHGARHGEMTPLMNEAVEYLGRSKDWIYKKLKEVGHVTGRARRSDAGKSICTEADAMLISNFLRQSRRKTGKQLLSIEDAIKIAFENGMIKAILSVSVVSRAMMRHGVHPSQMKAATTHSRLRSLYPNHVWQFDASTCVLFYLKDKVGLHSMPIDKYNKNKSKNFDEIRDQRVQRYLVIDHCTGAFYLEYFLSPGETGALLYTFLMNAFHKREGKDPFHGLPKIMYWDRGTGNTCHMTVNFVERLGIEHFEHETGNPRAKGLVEGMNDIVEKSFEGRLSFKEIKSLEELNKEAHIWMRNYNAKKVHSRHGHSRYGAWQTIKKDQLIIAPPRNVCEAVLQQRKPQECKVKGDLTFQFAIKDIGSQYYSVKEILDVRVDDKVKVYVNPFRYPNVDVIRHDDEGKEKIFECKPILFDEYNFPIDAAIFGETYKPTRETETDKKRREMDKVAYGVDTEGEVDACRKKRQPAFAGVDPFSYLEKETTAHFMDRKGTRRLLEAPHIESPRMSVTKSLMQIQKELRFSPEEMQALKIQLRERHPEGCTQEELRYFISEVNKDNDFTQATAG